MDVRKAIVTRRTVHRYSTRPIPDGAIEHALEAAVAAPNHKLTNPWRYTLVGPETRQQLTDLYVRIKAKSKGLTDARERAWRAKVGDPPELVVVSQVLADDEFRRREDFAAVACSINNLMLALWNNGISSKWNTGSITRHPETYELVGVDRQLEEIVGFVWVGYPREGDENLPKPPRRPLQEVVRRVG